MCKRCVWLWEWMTKSSSSFHLSSHHWVGLGVNLYLQSLTTFCTTRLDSSFEFSPSLINLAAYKSWVTLTYTIDQTRSLVVHKFESVLHNQLVHYTTQPCPRVYWLLIQQMGLTHHVHLGRKFIKDIAVTARLNWDWSQWSEWLTHFWINLLILLPACILIMYLLFCFSRLEHKAHCKIKKHNRIQT